MHGSVFQLHHFLSGVDAGPVADKILFALDFTQNFAILNDFYIVLIFHLMRAAVRYFRSFLKMREFRIEIEMAEAVLG